MTDMIAITTLICAGLVVISVLTSLISFRIGAPLLLVFLGVGLVAGEDGIGGIQFENTGVAYFVGSVALSIILFDSGFTTRLRVFRQAAGPAITLSTLGVLMTAAVVAVPAYFLLDIPWLHALLLGAIVGSTDAAAVFFLLRVGGIQIRERVRATLEVESGSNDPMAVFLTIALMELILAGQGLDALISLRFLFEFLMQMGLGALFGLVLGYLVVQGINRIRLEPALYPIVIIGLALCIFALTSLMGGSGFLGIYVAGAMMGNLELKGGTIVRRFQEGLTWLAQIAMFLVLGLLATPSEFPAIAWKAVAIGLLLMFVARPLAVWLCLLPFRFRWQESAFVAWVGLRGAVSILLAILPIAAGLEGGQMMFNTAFIIVLTSLMVQGWTIGTVARKLGLIVPPNIGPVDKVELELPGTARYELLAYRIAKGSPVAEGERIPKWARPSLVVRGGETMHGHEAGHPQAGDYVYIFVATRLANLLDRLFAQPVLLSEEDEQYFGEFTIDPKASIGAVADYYGFVVAAGDADLSVADFLIKRLGPSLGRGDRLFKGTVELIVRDVTTAQDGSMTLSVGLALDPEGAGVSGWTFSQAVHSILCQLGIRDADDN